MTHTFSLRLRSGSLVALPKPALMGIINVSPDSFFNAHQSLDEALYTVEQMVQTGVTMLDIGGEATNPNISLSSTVSSALEMDRVLPLVTAVRQRFDTLISIDTSNVALMSAAIAEGADIINDQRALKAEGAVELVAKLGVPVCLMHFFSTPRVPGSTTKEQLLTQIKAELMQRVAACQAAGITEDRIILDPGFGQGNYAKNADENFYLLAKLGALTELGYPVLSGWSRKSMLGEALGGVGPDGRLLGTVAADSLATFLGAHILRGHDVKAMADAVAIATRVRDASGGLRASS